MNFKKLDKKDFDFLSSVAGSRNSISDASRKEFGHDETEDLMFLPEQVFLPETTEQVSQILAYCNERYISVTPRGAGIGLSGGTLPVHGGVVVSM